VLCHRCRTDNPAHAKFCLECAAPLRAPLRSPDTYTPNRLAERILGSRAALEGERKQVTVLFADLKGSMELLADRDPEEARKLLDPVLEHMIEAVHRYEGMVNQVMGDGIMALFGAPIAHEDHAVRACYAALRMQESVKRYAADVKQGHGTDVQIRVGMNSGEVVVRAIGSDLHMDYTAVGQTTHLAARMEQQAAAGTIRVTEYTRRLAEGYVDVRPLGALPVKGLPAPIAVYEVTGHAAAPSRLHVAAARGLSAFVGCVRELDQLREAAAQVAQGHGQVVAVAGEPGVGKSRVYWEFLHSGELDGWRIFQTGAQSYGTAMPYLPVVRLLHGVFGIAPRDDVAAIQQKVTRGIGVWGPDVESTLPALLFLLDVPVVDADWVRLDASQRRQRIFDALECLVFRESQRQPVALIVEDLHWIDRATQAVLDRLVETLAERRVLMLVNHRPGYEPGWAGLRCYRHIRLEPLPSAEADAFLHTLLGHDCEALKRVLITRTEGNPFFAEEAVRTLAETGVLVGDRGAYRVAREMTGTLILPSTIQALLAARIDRLPENEKALLQVASVVGKDIPVSLLAAVTRASVDTVRNQLRTLEEMEFVYQTSGEPELEYTFKHALTQEVAYASLLHDQRRAQHARVLVAAEDLYAGRLGERIEWLATHALKGEAWEKAVPHLWASGTKAFGRSAHTEAILFFERGLEACRHLDDSGEAQAQRIDLHCDLRNAFIASGQPRKGLAEMRRAEELAVALDDPRRVTRVSILFSASLWLDGQSAEARTYGEKACRLADSVGDLALQIGAQFYFGQACLWLGEFDQAARLIQRVLDRVSGDARRERFGLAALPAVLARVQLATLLGYRGEWAAALPHAQEARRLAEEVGHRYSQIVARLVLATAYAAGGEFITARAWIEEILRLSQEWEIPLYVPLLYAWQGRVLVSLGRPEEAIPLLGRAIDDSDRLGMLPYAPQFLTHLAVACLHAGKRDDALRHGEQALTLARARREKPYEVEALHGLGQIAAARGSDQPAADYYSQALDLAIELGMRPVAARCHAGLSDLYRHAGRHAQALEEFTVAATMYREMGMRFWLEDLERRAGQRHA